MSDHYDQWYEAQVLKGRDMFAVLPPSGGNHDRHTRPCDRGFDRAGLDSGAEQEGA